MCLHLTSIVGKISNFPSNLKQNQYPFFSTFVNAYRYRKAMKAIEDSVPEVKPFAPLLSASFESREVPPNTSAELVFFCRRVYEFRLKRLIKNPS